MPDTETTPRTDSNVDTTICDDCGNAVGQDHLEAVIDDEDTSKVKIVCSDCIAKRPANTDTPTTKTPEKPKDVAPETISVMPEQPVEKLIESVRSAERLRTQARRFNFNDMETALTDAIESTVANLEADDIDEWKPYGALRKTLDGVEARWRTILTERTSRERQERRMAANRIRGIAGMHQESINLVELQQATRETKTQEQRESPIIGKILLPERPETPDDIPCRTEGCDGIIPGIVVANWKGSKDPIGGWKCKKCRPLTNRKEWKGA